MSAPSATFQNGIVATRIEAISEDSLELVGPTSVTGNLSVSNTLSATSGTFQDTLTVDGINVLEKLNTKADAEATVTVNKFIELTNNQAMFGVRLPFAFGQSVNMGGTVSNDDPY